MKGINKKLVIDAVMTVLLVAAMFIQVTGVVLHEIIGMLMFVLVVAHLVLERKWIAGSVKRVKAGVMRKARWAKSLVAVLLLISMVAMAASSVVISTLLYRAGLDLSALNASGLWTMVHVASAYVICGLVAIHLAMHWTLVVGCFGVPYDPSRRAAIGTAVNAAAAVGMVALGVAGAQAMGSNWDALQGVASQQAPDPAQEPAPAAASAASSSSAPTASPEKPGKRGQAPEGADAASGQSSSADTSTSSSSQAGVCTLCKKLCPLSSPRCNKPYQAGLI